MKSIDFEVTIENLENDIKHLYTIIRPEIKFEEVEYVEFEGGIINSIVKLDDPQNKDPLVVRSYNLKINSTTDVTDNGEDDMFNLSKFQNRELELKALDQASCLGITVKLIATYKNGFIYKFIDGNVNSFELYDKEVARQIAIKMARLHQIDLSDLASDKPVIMKFIEHDTHFDKLKSFLDDNQKKIKFKEFQTIIPPYSELENSYKQLHNILLMKNAYGKICFCHNDLNMTNILIDKKTKEPIFIDFEWSDTNFQMYDISYHLLNMGGSFLQYFNPKHVPNNEFIRDWLRFYYIESNKMKAIELPKERFDDFIENELKKVIINMLAIRIQLITRALFIFAKSGNSDEASKDYCVSVYNDFLKRRDDELKLADMIK